MRLHTAAAIDNTVRGETCAAEQAPSTGNCAAQGISEAIAKIRQRLRVTHRLIPVLENGIWHSRTVELQGYGPIRRMEGRFYCYVFRLDDQWQNYEVLTWGAIDTGTLLLTFEETEELFLRIDSGCTTGQVYHDNTCECREQLHLALELLAKTKGGLIVRIPNQDGRGMGIAFKLGTLELHEQFGLDTVTAARLLAGHHSVDRRSYSGVVAILKYFGLTTNQRIALATNNPAKRHDLEENGYVVTTRIPVRPPITEETRIHIAAKNHFLGHDP